MEGSPVSPGQVLRPSGIFSPDVIEDIQVKAELGRYRIRGFGTLRRHPLPSFEDLTFLPCTLTRIPSKATGKSAAPRRCWAAAWLSIPSSSRSPS